MSPEIDAFVKVFVKDLSERNVAIFAGAGMSVSQGFVNWPELLREIADELGLDVDRETDLISLAQFHVNEKGGRGGLNRKILEEFTEEAESGVNHEILVRLPITTYWTTNYDTLIEDALETAYKRPDVKYDVEQLAITKPRRDAVVYKMHGDVEHPANAVITKQDYQSYYKDHEAFITALSGDLVSKTFLFIGFSFTDPNLEYVLGRLAIQYGKNSRPHYCFIRQINRGDFNDDDSFEYAKRKQELMINDLKRYQIQTLLITKYSEITDVLKEIERRFKKRSIFISGSAEEYGQMSRSDAQALIHTLSREIVQAKCTVVNGFGWGVGSAVINGALEAIYGNPKKISQDQLILFPFPQFATGNKELSELWHEYRNRMISLCGISIFIFGNKKNDKGDIVNADGVHREFRIAVQQGAIPIPIPSTGYMSEDIWNEILINPRDFYAGFDWIISSIEALAKETDPLGIANGVVQIIKKLQE